ncbi:MAG TPA: tetratricopeptide repeat protein [Candidatus Latescibacteria bacterium]|nr:tetratricopeptide repeat protein [Candidatus Latescibacterota bacterium]
MRWRYIFLWLLLPSSASPVELLGIRVGRHQGFTRLVFDFDRRVFYSMIREQDRLKLSFIGAECRGVGGRRIRDRRVERVSLTQMGETLLALVYPRGRTVPRAYSIYEEGIFKVVVDLYDFLSTDLYMSRGVEYLRKGLYEDALAMFQAILTLYPDHPIARLELGRTLEIMGDYEGALQALCEVPRSSPVWGEAQAELAMLYGKLGREEEAAGCWQEVVNWVEVRFGAHEESPRKGPDRRWGIVFIGCAVLIGVGGGYGVCRALGRRRSVELDEPPSEKPEEEPRDDKAELVRRMARRGESREAISKELGMSLREVELALKLKGTDADI